MVPRSQCRVGCLSKSRPLSPKLVYRGQVVMNLLELKAVVSSPCFDYNTCTITIPTTTFVSACCHPGTTNKIKIWRKVIGMSTHKNIDDVRMSNLLGVCWGQ